jgi:glycine/D-amino acid oxidase-like deaminating enzyme/nitrite reductase/ring-hydroxylating ferredoxin subunit
VTSLWLDRATPIADDPLPPPDQPLDALVVGAGLTGLTTSLLLARAGLRVACVEARHVGAVTTGRTTGKVSLLQGTHLSRIVRHQPVDVASAYVDANREGMEWLLRFCADHDVAVQRRTAVTYAATDDELKAVEEEHHAATTLGLPVTWRDTLDVPFPHVGSTNLADQAQLDAMDVLAALVAQVRQHGGTVHQGHRVRSVSQRGTPTVRLEGGGTLGAEHVVLATGTPILDRGLHFARLEPQRSYVLALEGAQPLEGMYLSAGSDSRSLRDAPGGTLVVGGSGHVVGRTDSHLAHLEALRSWAATWYPQTTETHHWSAQDYGSPDGLPIVERLARSGGHVHVATGFQKWGMANAVAAARTISSDILGEPPPWAQVLHGRHLGPSGAAEVARINAGVGVALATGAARTLRQRLPGAAAPAQAHECGVVGVCTHLGGLLKWNDAEESWDCPLHGSRFTRDGDVLEGPATRPLLRRSGGADVTAGPDAES